MNIELEQLLPREIEAKSFEIIEKELGDAKLEKGYESIIKRVIHTTADFDYVHNLVFSKGALESALAALQKGACIVTDTKMAMAGINKKALQELGGRVYNFMGDADVAKRARENHTTRAAVCMEKAASLDCPVIVAVGNAPTALIRLYELVQEGNIRPELIIGTPVGFVNVVQSKELILSLPTPYMVAKGRKGGSNVAAAIVNALLYMLYDPRE